MKLKNDLFRLALIDKSMTTEENKIINSAISNLSELRQYARKVELDGVISDVELINLQIFIKKIGEDCIMIANQGDNITLEEKIVLTHIRKALLELIELVQNINLKEEEEKMEM